MINSQNKNTYIISHRIETDIDKWKKSWDGKLKLKQPDAGYKKFDNASRKTEVFFYSTDKKKGVNRLDDSLPL